jgi:hypothetical protein
MTEQPRQPPYFTETDAIPLPDGYPWTPQEHWAWARILRGEVADMSDFDPGLDRTKDFAAWIRGKDDGAGWKANDEVDGALTTWPAHRRLSATFLKLILFQSPYASAPACRWVRISSAEIIEPLNWVNESFDAELRLSRCRFHDDVAWQGLHIGKELDLSGSRLMKAWEADGIIVAGQLFCRDGFFVEGEVRLFGAKVAGQAEFSGAKLGGDFSGDYIDIKGSLLCDDGFATEGMLSLTGAKIGGSVIFDGATLKSGLSAALLDAEGGLFCRYKFTTNGDVSLLGAHIGGNAEFDGATLHGLIEASGMSVEGSLFLRDMIRLGHANLIAARIRGQVQLRQSTIEGAVDFTGASIDGELHLAKDAEKPGPKWGSDGRLILRNTTIGALAGGVDSFPKPRKGTLPPMELTGLAYTRLGGLGAGNDKAGSLAEASHKQLIAWLEAGHAQRDFTPGPYRQLASALVAAGHTGKANRILHAMRRHERDCEKSRWRKFGLFMSGITIGFGYRNQYAAYWFTVLVLAFAALGLNWNAVAGLNPGAARPFAFSDAGWNEFGRWAGFSFGNSIPLIQLDKAHETFLAVEFVPGAASAEEPERFVHQVPATIAWVFYAQKVLGFVILSFLAAGLTGTATRQRD